MKNLKIIALLVLILIFAVTVFQRRMILRLRSDRDAYRTTSEALIRDVERYRTAKGLSAVKSQQMQLTLREFERYRQEDARTIESLRLRLRDVEAVGHTRLETIYTLTTALRDSLVVDSSGLRVDTVRCLSYRDEWLSFDGCFDSLWNFRGSITGREDLLYVETVIYRRFLGFLWRTRRVERREQDIVSRNPHTTILDTEFITIRR